MFILQERSPLFRHLPAFVQDMTDGDAEACQFDHGLGLKSALRIIDVAGHGSDWRDLLQLLEHGPVVNVPGVEK